MEISIIGSGNAATVLARLCVLKGHKIKKIVARNPEAAKELAQRVGAEYENISSFKLYDADLIIIAVSDHALPAVLAGLYFMDVPVVHTAGSVSIDVLKNNADNYGVLYPLQSLRKEMEIIPPIPFLIEANNAKTFEFIQHFAATLSDNVRAQSAEDRFKLHAAAVVVNNFTNYLYGLAENFCQKESLDFNLLKPLIRETAERIQCHSPVDVQTGPALRKDHDTITKHLEMFSSYPKLSNIYKIISEEIINKHQT